jgi:uncharacterized protein YjbJ (UPF0337 family)
MGKKKKAKNLEQKTKGKIKEKVGKSTGDEPLEAKGNVEQAVADVKQAGEKVKDALKK